MNRKRPVPQILQTFALLHVARRQNMAATRQYYRRHWAHFSLSPFPPQTSVSRLHPSKTSKTVANEIWFISIYTMTVSIDNITVTLIGLHNFAAKIAVYTAAYLQKRWHFCRLAPWRHQKLCFHLSSGEVVSLRLCLRLIPNNLLRVMISVSNFSSSHFKQQFCTDTNILYFIWHHYWDQYVFKLTVKIYFIVRFVSTSHNPWKSKLHSNYVQPHRG